MAQAASPTRSPRAVWPAYAACAWTLVFAAVHVYWALGGTVGLPPGFTVSMNRALFVIDLVSIPLSGVGALLALTLVRPWGRRFPRGMLLTAAWGVCTLMLLHAAPTLIEGGLIATGLVANDLSAEDRLSLVLYEPWFLIGGTLFGTAAWCYGRASAPAPARGGA